MPPSTGAGSEAGHLAGELKAIEALCAALIASHPKPAALRVAFQTSSTQLLALSSAPAGGQGTKLHGMEALIGTFGEAIDQAVERRLRRGSSARVRQVGPSFGATSAAVAG